VRAKAGKSALPGSLNFSAISIVDSSLPFQRKSRGFTLLEMLIGMTITAVVFAALATVMVSVAQGWQSGDGTQSLQVQAAQVYARVRYYLSSAKYIGLVNAGSLNGSPSTPGSVFYWAYDGWNGVQDGGPEVGEMMLIQHDPTTSTLWLYEPIPVVQMTAQQMNTAGTSMDFANMGDPTWVAKFKTIATPIALGHNITGATFAADYLASAIQRPMVEFTLAIDRSPLGIATQYDTALLRAPTTQPN
jgi:prepilin-type N-terminal cleavage/methylation domain-containing protein